MFAQDFNEQTLDRPFEVASTKAARQSMNSAVEKLTRDQLDKLERIASEAAKGAAGKDMSSNLRRQA